MPCRLGQGYGCHFDAIDGYDDRFQDEHIHGWQCHVSGKGENDDGWHESDASSTSGLEFVPNAAAKFASQFPVWSSTHRIALAMLQQPRASGGTSMLGFGSKLLTFYEGFVSFGCGGILLATAPPGVEKTELTHAANLLGHSIALTYMAMEVSSP